MLVVLLVKLRQPTFHQRLPCEAASYIVYVLSMTQHKTPLMQFSLNFFSLQREPSMWLLAKNKKLSCKQQCTTTACVHTYNNQLVRLQSKTAQQVNNPSHTSAVRVPNNNQQCTEWRTGLHCHDKQVELPSPSNFKATKQTCIVNMYKILWISWFCMHKVTW